jgi:hypothetical protein
MSRIAALAIHRSVQLDVLRSLIVASCAAALILARVPLPF